VLSHAKALPTSVPEGECAYVDADMHDPDAILAEAAKTLDFSEPAAVMFVAVLQYAGDDAEVSRIVNHLMAACATGAHAISSGPVRHGGAVGTPERREQGALVRARR
jgi:hypothetical protein